MASISIRTEKELERAQWADRYMNVVESNLYAKKDGEVSAFPKHEYFKNKLLGKKIQMCEVNPGASLVENMVADTLTDMKVQIGTEENDDDDKETMKWLEEIDFHTKLEESLRSLFGVGYMAQQPVRFTVDGENAFSVNNVDPATWYPTVPPRSFMPLAEGRIISIIPAERSGQTVYYTYIEHHTIGRVEYKLYELERPDSLEGKPVSLSRIPGLSDLKDGTTDLDFLAVFQRNRQKTSRKYFGQSVLAPIWSMLQEITEIQTQMRHERIKHFKAKLAAPDRALQRVERQEPDGPTSRLPNSKQVAVTQLYHDLMQEIFPIPPNGQVPQYIVRDLQSITIGMEMIDDLLSKCAAFSGAPRSAFNLDDAGDQHVDTEKRKHKRYVRQIIQAQKQAAILTRQQILAWRKWSGKEEAEVKVSFANPFAMSQEEIVAIMREMNPSATMVSQKEAIAQVWSEKSPEDREKLLEEIKEESSAQPTMQSLQNPPSFEL